MNKKKKELLDKLEAKNTEVNGIYDAAGDDELSTDQKQAADRLEKEMGEIENELAPILEREGNRQKAQERAKSIAKNRLPLNSKEEAEITDNVARTLGQKFANSLEFKAYLKTIAPTGRISEKTHINTPAVEFKGLSSLNSKAIHSGAASAGALVEDVRTETVIEGFMRELTIRDLLTIVPTEGDNIEYARMNQFSNNAGTVAESNVSKFTGAVGQVEGRKAESDLALELVKDRVRTIAHWMTESNKILWDAPQLAALVETFLLYGLREKSESLVVSGDGNGENFLGILNTPNIQIQPFVTDIATSLRKARTKLKTPGRVQPTAIALNPLDWEKLDLSQDGEGRYHWGGPTVMGNPRCWGLPVIESEAVPEGTGIVAAWKFGVLYDRLEGLITATNSHEDYFVRNLLAVLAECREGFGVRYTKAFCAVDLAA